MADGDDDIKVLNVLSSNIKRIGPSIDDILWQLSHRVGLPRKVHSTCKPQALERAILLIEPFQEEPQLLDVQLKTIIPQLVEAFWQCYQKPRPHEEAGRLSTSSAICRLLYTFCKVRGEKIIIDFLSNEPRYLEPLFDVYERLSAVQDDTNLSSTLTWQENYIFLLWLSHLMLVPFDLQTIASGDSKDVAGEDLELPSGLPGIAARLVRAARRSLKLATREQHAAALLIVRLCCRPDMYKLNLFASIVSWTIKELEPDNLAHLTTYEELGHLIVVCRFTSSASLTELNDWLARLFVLFQDILRGNLYEDFRSLATVRKLAIKGVRNLMLLSLQTPDDAFDTMTILEDTVDMLLQMLADSDSPVRFAASKALSKVAQNLDPSIAHDIIEAIIGSFEEDIIWEGHNRILTAVNALRWHGLTLSLAHILYNRAAPPELLPNIINALVLSLDFEQRSAVGGSVGTNVRDAACFGIWAMTRRYSTAELAKVDTSSMKSMRLQPSHASIQQYLASQLIVAACLDPAGNIRRGSSAALQELVGRHPDIVKEGISLVQLVDYHAVGLRERAMVDVASSVSHLDESYHHLLFQNMLGWRGACAADMQSRVFASRAIARLSIGQDFAAVLRILGPVDLLQQSPSRLLEEEIEHGLTSALVKLKPRQIEERHGILLAIAEVLTAYVDLVEPSKAQRSPKPGDLVKLSQYEAIITALNLQNRDFTASSQRPELTAIATCALISGLCLVRIGMKVSETSTTASFDTRRCGELLSLCLLRTESSVRKEAGKSAKNLIAASADYQLVENWLEHLEKQDRHSERLTCHDTALSYVFELLHTRQHLQKQIVDSLAAGFTDSGAIESKVHGLEAFADILGSIGKHKKYLGSCWTEDRDTTPEINGEIRVYAVQTILRCVSTGLNDYTINQRGDVGSQVRLAALSCLEAGFESGLVSFHGSAAELRYSTMRLALEKLDKARLQGKETYIVIAPTDLQRIDGVSSKAYFRFWLDQLSVSTAQEERLAILTGYVSSAGSGAEAIRQTARGALVEWLENVSRQVEAGRMGLEIFGTLLVTVLRDHIGNERVLLTTLELLVFLLDMQLLQQITSPAFKWRSLLVLVQKCHYKSTILPKLLLALDIYRSLAGVEAIRQETIAKVVSMLSHPFPNVRTAAAETLLLVSRNGEGRDRDDKKELWKEFLEADWSRPSSENRSTISLLKTHLNVK